MCDALVYSSLLSVQSKDVGETNGIRSLYGWVSSCMDKLGEREMFVWVSRVHVCVVVFF